MPAYSPTAVEDGSSKEVFLLILGRPAVLFPAGISTVVIEVRGFPQFV